MEPQPLEYQPPALMAEQRRAAARALRARGLKIAGIVLLCLALAAAGLKAGLGVYRKVSDDLEAERARRAYRNESVALLGAAKTPGELEQAVEPDGVVLAARDGSWVAVRSGVGAGGLGSPSPLAVARDSGGGWFESTRPFHLELAHYRVWQKPRALAKQSRDPLWDERAFLSIGVNRPLDALEQSADLARARERLKELGFREFKP